MKQTKKNIQTLQTLSLVLEGDNKKALLWAVKKLGEEDEKKST